MPPITNSWLSFHAGMRLTNTSSPTSEMERGMVMEPVVSTGLLSNSSSTGQVKAKVGNRTKPQAKNMMVERRKPCSLNNSLPRKYLLSSRHVRRKNKVPQRTNEPHLRTCLTDLWTRLRLIEVVRGNAIDTRGWTKRAPDDLPRYLLNL
jgi:hypothetical protein